MENEINYDLLIRIFLITVITLTVAIILTGLIIDVNHWIEKRKRNKGSN
jgi:hypothetical protein